MELNVCLKFLIVPSFAVDDSACTHTENRPKLNYGIFIGQIKIISMNHKYYKSVKVGPSSVRPRLDHHILVHNGPLAVRKWQTDYIYAVV